MTTEYRNIASILKGTNFKIACGGSPRACRGCPCAWRTRFPVRCRCPCRSPWSAYSSVSFARAPCSSSRESVTAACKATAVKAVGCSYKRPDKDLRYDYTYTCRCKELFNIIISVGPSQSSEQNIAKIVKATKKSVSP